MKVSDFQKYILIFLILVIMICFFTEIQKYRKERVLDKIRVIYTINQMKGDCFYTNSMYYFKLVDCERLEVGDSIELIGRIDQAIDSSLMAKKRLIVEDKILYKPKKVSFYYWYAKWAKFIDLIRRVITSTAKAALPYPQSGLVLSMVFGQPDVLDAHTQALFSDSGTTHLQAISGYNFAVITAGIYQAGKKHAGKRVLAMLMFILSVCFTCIVGTQPSVIRAALALTTLLIVKFFLKRQHNPRFYLVIILVLMLVVNPSWLFSLGFQLSALATTGILYFSPLFEYEWIKRGTPIYLSVQKRSWLLQVYKELVSSICAALAAQLLTTPLLLWHFNETSIGSFIVTIASTTLLSIIVGFAFWLILVCIGLSYLPLHVLLFTWTAVLLFAPIEIFLFILKTVAQQPLLHFPVPGFSFIILIPVYASVIVFYFYLAGKSKFIRDTDMRLL